MSPSLVTLIVREECALCDAARRTVVDVVREHGAMYEEKSISADPSFELYAEEVPAVLIDGVLVDFWFINRGRLARLLSEVASLGYEDKGH